MLNPDGVVFGNYRCSQLGCDLNRKWNCANRLLHPSIYYTIQMMKMMRFKVKIQFFVDMHGHNRKMGTFFYGGTYLNYQQDGRTNNALIRILPLLCCQKNKKFLLKNCRFHLDKSKEGTARQTVFQQFNIMHSFTLEASYLGIRDENKKLKQFMVEDYESCGRTLLSIFF